MDVKVSREQLYRMMLASHGQALDALIRSERRLNSSEQKMATIIEIDKEKIEALELELMLCRAGTFVMFYYVLVNYLEQHISWNKSFTVTIENIYFVCVQNKRRTRPKLRPTHQQRTLMRTCDFSWSYFFYNLICLI